MQTKQKRRVKKRWLVPGAVGIVVLIAAVSSPAAQRKTTSSTPTASARPVASHHDAWQTLKDCLQAHPLLLLQNGGGTMDLADHATRHLTVWSQIRGSVAGFDLDPSRQEAAKDVHDYLQATQGSGATMEQTGPLLYQFTSGATDMSRSAVTSCVQQAYGG
jgi:hypothetical protein